MTIAHRAHALVSVLAVVAGCFDQNVPSSFSGGQGDAGDAGDAGSEAAAGDGGGCPILTSTLTVVVVDAVNGADVCDATVTASSGATTLTLTMYGNPATCAYSAGQPPPPPGTYTINVTAPNYLSVTQTGVVITQDSCGTEAPTVTIPLPVAPADAGPG
jgi:hypothetical protein